MYIIDNLQYAILYHNIFENASTFRKKVENIERTVICMKRTDLACEFAAENTTKSGITIDNTRIGNMKISTVVIDADGESLTKRAQGRYITVECKKAGRNELSYVLAEILRPLVPDGKVIVTGLGNEYITPDALGVKTAALVAATSHFSHTDEFAALSLRSVSVVQTGVAAQTGIESAQQMKFLSDGLKPAAVIVVDSLACSELTRLCATVQITDTGIAPGSGVENTRQELSSRTLGIPVIAIGVPTVIDLDNLVETQEKIMVTPRNIETVIAFFAEAISSALNTALNPNLSESELRVIKPRL